jgi:hypothetical protein
MRALIGCLALLGMLLSIANCRTAEGDRCNPLRFSDECGPERKCSYPPNCAVAYCCPAEDRITPDTHPNCQACPPLDGGTD